MWWPDPAKLGPILLGAGTGLALTVLLQWMLQPVAHKLDLLDYPQGRKDHAHPTPVTGGLAMVAAAITVSLGMRVPMSGAFHGYIYGSLLLIVVGLLDDRHDLAWWVRIPAQVVAALLMVYVGGVRVEHIGPLFGLAVDGPYWFGSALMIPAVGLALTIVQRTKAAA